jgi:hypothetical protein
MRYVYEPGRAGSAHEGQDNANAQQGNTNEEGNEVSDRYRYAIAQSDGERYTMRPNNTKNPDERDGCSDDGWISARTR